MLMGLQLIVKAERKKWIDPGFLDGSVPHEPGTFINCRGLILTGTVAAFSIIKYLYIIEDIRLRVFSVFIDPFLYAFPF